METNESAEVRVQRGVRYLGETHPGWLARINLETLVLRYADRCVIAQATGTNYLAYYGLKDGRDPCQHALDHGFYPMSAADLGALEDAWKATIRALKG